MFSLHAVEKGDTWQLPEQAPGSYFTQGEQYALWQEAMGRSVLRYEIRNDTECVACFNLIIYPLFRSYSYGYIPHGPVILVPGTQCGDFFKKELSRIAQEHTLAFIRFDTFPTSEQSKFEKYFTEAPLATYFSAFFQSKYDWVLPIRKDADTLLMEMHEKTRYSIRLSERKEVTAQMIQGENMLSFFEDFYSLMCITAKRGGFALHPKQYYKVIFESARMNPDIVLFVAQYKTQILATHLVYFYGNTAYYPFGGSSNEERPRNAPYALHWAAILEAKKRGCEYYNFGAIEAGEHLKHDNWSGISDFKRKFRGELVEFSDFLDHIEKPLWYYLYVVRKILRKAGLTFL